MLELYEKEYSKSDDNIDQEYNQKAFELLIHFTREVKEDYLNNGLIGMKHPGLLKYIPLWEEWINGIVEGPEEVRAYIFEEIKTKGITLEKERRRQLNNE